MFTIKHCHDFSEELYHSAENVRATTNHCDPLYGVQFVVGSLHHHLGSDGPPVQAIGHEPPEKGQRGVIFVMNDSGKTVATYHI